MTLHHPMHTLGHCCHPHATYSWHVVPPSIRGQAQRAAHLLVRKSSRQAGAASSLLAEQACSTQDSSTCTPAHGADKQASSWAQLPGHPRGYRCRLCFETDFSTRGHLAEHLVSVHPVLGDDSTQTHSSTKACGRINAHRRMALSSSGTQAGLLQVGRKHAGAWTGQQHTCPYCGKAHGEAGALRDHIRSGCRCIENEYTPARYTRYARQRNFDMDPRYEALLDVRSSSLTLHLMTHGRPAAKCSALQARPAPESDLEIESCLKCGTHAGRNRSGPSCHSTHAPAAHL